MTTTANTDLDLLQNAIAKARKAGAETADAIMVSATSMSASWRLGQNEGVERAEGRDLGLRVLIGTRQAVVSSSELHSDAISALAERAVSMARVVPEDEYCGLPDRSLLATDQPDLDLCDNTEPSSEALLETAQQTEDAARAMDGINNSEGAEADWARARISLASSDGFSGSYESSRFGVVVSVVAGSGTKMERDYAYSSVRHQEDLDTPDYIGKLAAGRALGRLNPRKVKSCQVPVIFAPRISNGFLRLLSGSISGPSIARKTSFLKDSLDQMVFSPEVTITDDPLRRRGLNSHPFDGEGVGVAKKTIVDKGRLTTWLLDSRSGRQLGLPTTGHAARGTGGPPNPSPSNLYMERGDQSPEDLIADIDQGFYVTEMMGMSFNGITGDYSRGAAGFWIDKGQIAYPVSELTVAGNMKDLFKTMVPADDLEYRYGLNAPTLRVEGMTVAGL